MAAEPLRLDALLESVADGASVDWDAAEAAATDDQRKLLRHLRLVAGIADVHRTAPLEDLAAGDAPLPWPAAGPGLPRWGHLVPLELVGEGAFGEVYRAHDPWLDRQVALKLLKPSITGPARLIAEAQALARVRHPNVVTVHGADLNDGRVGLWMEFVRGRTLSEIVASDGPFSAAEAVIIGQELCKAVAAVHAVDLVHRDIKAQNVMRESGGRLVLMDFGAGHTPLYTAPELVDGGEATIATDIYALGVLLYYLVVGKYPVTGSSLEALRDAHARGDRRRLTDVRPDLPERFVAVVERALHPDPRQRYASAVEMQEALRAPRAHRLSRRSWWAAAVCLLLALGAIGYLASRWRPPVRAGESSLRVIALLPLRADGDGPSYFADGMTDALTQELAGIDAVRVISRESVDRALRVDQAPSAIARALQADALLEGTVSRAGEQVRVDVTLLLAGGGAPALTRTFERPLRDLRALQREVAVAVAEQLGLAPPSSQAARQLVDPQAHEAYLRGRGRLQTQSLANTVQALEEFRTALTRDPSHAAGQAGMAHAYFVLGAYGALPREDSYRLSANAAMRALALDERLPDAHVVEGELHFQRDWDWSAAERSFQRALALNPSHEYAHERYALYLAARGRTDEALAQLAEALRLDPLSPALAATRGSVLRYARRYDDAIAQLQGVLRQHPTHVAAQVALGRTLNAAGRYEEAFRQLQTLTQRPIDSAILGEIAQAEVGRGRTDAARAVLEQIRALETEQGVRVGPDIYAYVYGSLGDSDAAFAHLERAFQGKANGVLWLKVDSRADPLRSDPRLDEYLARLGLTP